MGKLTMALIEMVSPKEVQENLPEPIISKLKLTERFTAYCDIHFPKNKEDYERALYRLKFDEFFISQVRLGLTRLNRHKHSKGVVFEKVGEFFNTFYHRYLPFELTGAQKRVVKEIRADTGRGKQMKQNWSSH